MEWPYSGVWAVCGNMVVVCVCVSGSGVGEVGLCFLCCDTVTCGGACYVCGERHVVGGIGSLGSFVGGSARVGPGGELQVMLSCSIAFPSSVSVSSIRSMLVLCCGRWFGPCMCGCGSKAFCLYIWACVWGFLLVIVILE